MPLKAKTICPVCKRAVNNRSECHPPEPRPFGFRRSVPRLPDGAFVYDSQWSRLSKQIRQQRPVCQMCGERQSTQVDHIIRPQDRPDLRLNPDNLQALCQPCHYRKTHSKTGWRYSQRKDV